MYRREIGGAYAPNGTVSIGVEMGSRGQGLPAHPRAGSLVYRSVWKWAVVVRYRSVWKWAVVASRLPVRVAVEVDSRDQKLSDYEVCRDKVCATSLTAAAGVKSN